MGIILQLVLKQHGPTGLMVQMRFVQNDRAWVGEATGAIVINVGMALHHTAFPGTISLRQYDDSSGSGPCNLFNQGWVY